MVLTCLDLRKALTSALIPTLLMFLSPFPFLYHNITISNMLLQPLIRYYIKQEDKCN